MLEKKSSEVLGEKKCRNVTFLHHVKGRQRDEMPSSLSELSAACLAPLHSKLSGLSSEQRHRKFNTTVTDEAARLGKWSVCDDGIQEGICVLSVPRLTSDPQSFKTKLDFLFYTSHYCSV